MRLETEEVHTLKIFFQLQILQLQMLQVFQLQILQLEILQLEILQLEILQLQTQTVRDNVLGRDRYQTQTVRDNVLGRDRYQTDQKKRLYKNIGTLGMGIALGVGIALGCTRYPDRMTTEVNKSRVGVVTVILMGSGLVVEMVEKFVYCRCRLRLKKLDAPKIKIQCMNLKIRSI